MTTLRVAAQQALEALEDARLHNYALRHTETDKLIAALRAALEQQNTHAEGCWSWGPAHYDCALAEIKRLNRQEMIRAKFDEESG